MPQQPLSERCSLMGTPGGPPPPKTKPADCPVGGASIKMVDEGVTLVVPGDPPFPVIFEGGDGNDSVTVRGGPGKGILMDGGKGDDSLTIHGTGGGGDGGLLQLGSPIGQVTPTGTLMLGALALAMMAVVIIAWRMLAAPRR